MEFVSSLIKFTFIFLTLLLIAYVVTRIVIVAAIITVIVLYISKLHSTEKKDISAINNNNDIGNTYS